MTRVTLVSDLFINALALGSPETVALVGLTVDSKALLYLSMTLRNYRDCDPLSG